MIDYFDGIRWVEELAKVQKHGTHDQKTHGSWADGGEGIEVFIGDEARKILVTQIPQGDSPAHNEIKAAIETTYSQEEWDMRDKSWFMSNPAETIISRGEDKKINGALTYLVKEDVRPNRIDIVHTGSLKSGVGGDMVSKFMKRAESLNATIFLTPLEGSEGFWKKMGFVESNFGGIYTKKSGTYAVEKHESHDQSTHGSWANGGGSTDSGSDNSYQGGHQPDLEGAPLHDLTAEGYYPDGAHIYGTGNKAMDAKMYSLVQQFRGNPDAQIQIYRAVPKKASGQINSGDWVTPMKDYAIQHGVSNLNDDYEILTRTVSAKDITTSGDSWMEWGYSAPVQKHGEGDQKPHGSWADGSGGGNGLDHRAVYDLQQMSDPLKSKVYDAEEKYSPTVQRKLTKPFPPKNRDEYATKEEYDKEYKEYSKNWNKWSRETSRNIQSSTGEKHLDGTVKGIQNYINEVTNTDWFKKTFGNGGVIKTPKVSLTDSSIAGSYQIGFKRGVPFSGMYINRGFSLNEPVILHELAHYATTISTTKPFSAHGIEFATNHLYLTNKAVGSAFADGLKAAYKAEGVPLGN